MSLASLFRRGTSDTSAREEVRLWAVLVWTWRSLARGGFLFLLNVKPMLENESRQKSNRLTSKICRRMWMAP